MSAMNVYGPLAAFKAFGGIFSKVPQKVGGILVQNILKCVSSCAKFCFLSPLFALFSSSLEALLIGQSREAGLAGV